MVTASSPVVACPRKSSKVEGMSKTAPRLEPRLRFPDGSNAAFGPGKAELLEHIDRSGSISEAAKAMGMSYMRAWTIVKSLDRGMSCLSY